jgi:cytoskeletal protein CcmA (bactofilin family)
MFVGNTAQANVIQQVTVTGVEIFGAVSATGNITAANFLTSGATGNITGANVIEAVTVSASGNVLANNVLTTGVMSAGGNVTAGNVITGGLVSAGGNIFGVNVSASGNVNAANVNAVQLSLSGNVISTINSTNDINTSANISGANIIAGTVTATGNVWVDGNVKASTSVITPELTSTGALTISTASSGNINLQPNGTGNIVLANTYINGVAYPMQDQDAASKYYVDQATTTGFAFHAPVYVTTNTDLNTATGGTVSYNQPNGAGNGIGATLTTSGSFNLIDTANIQTVGTRVLVKNEANATWNGVYTYANASAIVRATDADEYGADSTQALSINDYFFTQSGNVNAGAAFVVSAPPGTITFGTSNIEFSQFSSTQVYSANTNAGLNLTGTVFSAKVDNNTTAFDGGGNIIVKASANLTTPNIGAATGTSLSVTGLVEAGNISTGGYVSAGGNVTGDNILTGGLVSAGGNVYAGNLSTGGNVTGANLLTAGLISAGGNATLGNVITGGYITATGNITVANMFTGGLISATGLVTAGNVETNGYMSSAGNVTAGNVNTSGLVKTQDFSILGNVVGNLIPSSNVTYNLGSSNRLWKDLYLSGTSIYIGDQTITSNASGIATGNAFSANNLVATSNVYTPGLTNLTGNITVTANTKSWVYNQNGNLYVPEAGQIRASSSFYGITLSDYSSLATLSLVDDATLQGNAYVRLQVIGGTQFDFSNGLANIKNANLSTTGNVIGGNILYGSGIVSGSGNVYGGTIYQSSNQVLDVTSTIDGGTY